MRSAVVRLTLNDVQKAVNSTEKHGIITMSEN